MEPTENTEKPAPVKKRRGRKGEKVEHPKRPGRIAPHPFDYPDEYLLETYNLNRAAIQELLFIVGPYIGNGVNKSYMQERKLAAALYFYNTGNPIKKIPTCIDISLYPGESVRAVQEVTTQIDKYAADILIDFPSSAERQENIQQRYLMATGFLGVIGSMDCFHVKISKPSYRLNASEYLNSFHFYSKHVQIISDYDMNILACFARYGGAVNEADIWEKSVVRKYMEKLHTENINECFLVASSNYTQEPWLLTPSSELTVRAQNFNECHEKAHLPVRRLIALLREEFPCLSPKGLRLYPGYAGAVINCCCALHNLRKKHNLPMPYIDDESLANIAGEYMTAAKATKIIRQPKRSTKPKNVVKEKNVRKKRSKKAPE